ncbi:Uncharacterised protein [BD1-7 clade bacterium]|uniref:O-antigen polysaccharide polymerase Wzy n=1 Tax=BD1-7 clade bacterium TaxID=2029982 RepID=A0A5S9QNP4_9GAMM|nr:Uncharacterised protein [BD1-7 clade bacterium]CAA0121492.1 Uncharacterised protein [BD1-7 clade bacterium]
MKIYTKRSPLLYFLLFFITFVPLIFEADVVKSFSYVLFFLHAVVSFFLLYPRGNTKIFFSPLAITIFYVDLSFALGAYAYHHGIVLMHTDNYVDYLAWTNTGYTTFYMLMCGNVLLFLAGTWTPSSFDYRHDVEKKVLAFALVSLCYSLPFFFMPLDASLFGGGSGGNLAVIPKSITALMFIYYLAYFRKKLRFPFYFLILIVFAISSAHSKREAIFLVFPILLLEALFNGLVLNFRSLVVGGVVFLLCVLLIIAMSIVRGYGGFSEVDGLFSALPHVAEYVISPLFLASFFNNIEVNYTYFHSMQALEYICDDSELLSYGSTIFKALFVFIPRAIWEGKPLSMISLYTGFHDPAFRASGGSYPVNLYSEAFWNFRIAGLAYILVVGLAVMTLYKKFIEALYSADLRVLPWALYVYMNFLTYVRGSGLDQYFAYGFLSFIYVALCYFTVMPFIKKTS